MVRGVSAICAASSPRGPRSPAPARAWWAPSASRRRRARRRWSRRSSRYAAVGPSVARRSEHAVHGHHRGGAGHRVADVDADAGAVGEIWRQISRTAARPTMREPPGWTQTTSSSSDQTAIRASEVALGEGGRRRLPLRGRWVKTGLLKGDVVIVGGSCKTTGPQPPWSGRVAGRGGPVSRFSVMTPGRSPLNT